MRTGEGFRRLALALGIIGVLIGGYYRAWPQYKTVRERGWHHAYFETQARNHPDATIEKVPWEPWQFVLTEPQIYREAFPKDWRIKPDWRDYAALLIPVALGFLIPWGIVRATAWVAHGFQIDRS